ncbi:uncharacterized protein UV8b_05498 [Ustilaginoidea virens]|uniref:Uncharacterized protein n=1 Tax=Ustilaginoidea virens TaxID=1159556 RepID=A0A8E5HTT2_USTVR|nr:uncharacterized protein UV8b_05498 [Ustilaginoidea virens]QUC21255.1 hypothetical protein UV8b_05498 [Ustilaginoidea virens]
MPGHGRCDEAIRSVVFSGPSGEHDSFRFAVARYAAHYPGRYRVNVTGPKDPWPDLTRAQGCPVPDDMICILPRSGTELVPDYPYLAGLETNPGQDPCSARYSSFDFYGHHLALSMPQRPQANQVMQSDSFLARIHPRVGWSRGGPLLHCIRVIQRKTRSLPGGEAVSLL